MNLVDEITNVSELRERLPSSPDARSEILAYYNALGEKLGYKSVTHCPVLFRGVSIGSTPLAWLEGGETVSVAFEIELSSEEKTVNALFKLTELSPKIAVVIIHSTEQQQNLLEKLRNYIFNSKLFQSTSQNYLLLDIATGTYSLVEKKLKPPLTWERKKKIFGVRGMHKEQD